MLEKFLHFLSFSVVIKVSFFCLYIWPRCMYYTMVGHLDSDGMSNTVERAHIRVTLMEDE